MEAQKTNYATFDDIVFEGRNKDYGAYLLRQEYTTELKKATVLAISIILLFLAGSYMAIKIKPDLVESIVPDLKDPINLEVTPILDEVIKLAKLAPTAPAVPVPITPSQEFREIRVVTDETPIVDNIPSQDAFSSADPGLHTVAGNPAGSEIPTTDLGNGTGDNTEEATEPFITVEKMPEFEGGLPALYKFINKHLKYPRSAQNMGLEGNVILTFVVNASGQISNIQVLKDIGGGAGEEAMRVVGKMPNWKPGIQNNRPVPVRFNLPIKFALD